MKFDDLVLHGTSRKLLGNYLENPAHALLLTGEVGVGLGTIAKSLAQTIAKTDVIIMRPRLHQQQKTAAITIDDVRELYEMTRDKRQDELVIVIDESEKLTRDAPEALLKLLEEPVANVFYILTSHAVSRLPATILSRVQQIAILPPAREVTAKLLENSSRKLTTAQKNQISFLAGNLPAEFLRLINDENYFRESAAGMENTKNFVTGSVVERLKIIANVDGRETAIALVKNIAKLLTLSAERSGSRMELIANNLTLTTDILDNLAQNGNVRAQLLNLATNLR